MGNKTKKKDGFSMIELLVSLLIMAVIAGVAITAYIGILNNSKSKADAETAREIKKQILVYLNASNDMNLSCITQGKAISGNDVVDALTNGITITETSSGRDNSDFIGTYGGYFESSPPRPLEPGKSGWDITINISTLEISVTASNNNGGKGKLTVNS